MNNAARSIARSLANAYDARVLDQDTYDALRKRALNAYLNNLDDDALTIERYEDSGLRYLAERASYVEEQGAVIAAFNESVAYARHHTREGAGEPIS